MNGQPRGRLGMMVGLGVIALLFFLLGVRGCWISPSSWLRLPWADGIVGPRMFVPFYGFLTLWGVLQAALAIWVGFDAHRKGLNGFLWGLLVLFTHIVGLIVYLLVSPTLAQQTAGVPAAPSAGTEPPAASCPDCGARVRRDYRHCPYCGTGLGCSDCGRPVEASWKACPDCGASVQSPPAGS